MRKTCLDTVYELAKEDKKVLFIGSDLGPGVLNDFKKNIPERFFMEGVSEQSIIGLSSGLAMEGFIPLVYSITPFVLYRPFELLRNYLDHEHIPVKLIGGGRDRDYGYLGFSHWAEEDVKVLSTLENIQLYKPKEGSNKIYKEFLYNGKPSYLNLKR